MPADTWQQPIVITMRPVRPWGAILKSVLALLVLAGGGGWCLTHSAATTSGHGQMGLTQPGASVPAATGNLAAVATPVTYRSTRGHFAAKFAASPVTATITQPYRGITVRGYVAADRVSRDAVFSLVVTPAVPSGERTAFLAGLVNGIQTGIRGAAVLRTSTGRFRGHHDATVDFAMPDGTRMTLVAVLWSAHRTFALQGPAGARMAALEKSFTVLR